MKAAKRDSANFTCKNANTGREQDSKNGLKALFGPILPSRDRELRPHVLLQCLPRPTRVFNVALRDRKGRHGGKRYKNGQGRQKNNDCQHQ